MRAIRAAVVLAALLAAAACERRPATAMADPFARRDGQEEALADLKTGRPTKLFTRVANGVAMGFDVPGVADCQPAADSRIFAGLAEADWSEGVDYTREQQAIQSSAFRFAERYNRSMFRARRSDVLRVCPAARLGE